MKESSKTGLEIIKIALVVGVAADLLLRAVPWGINVLAFNLIFAGAFLWLTSRNAPSRLTLTTYVLVGAQVFFAAMYTLRDSSELRVADAFAILAILSALFVPRLKIAAKVAGVFQYGIAFVWSSLSAIVAPALLLSTDIEWSGLSRDGWRRHVVSAVRGVALATPLILIFGGLFMAADSAYEGMVQRVFNIAPETLFSHALIFGLFTWLSAGYLRGVLISTPLGAVASATVASIIPDDAPQESRVDRVRAESGEHAVTLPDDKFVVEHINRSDPPNAAETTPAASDASDPSEPAETAKPFTFASIENTFLPKAFTLGAVEVGVILGLMNLLFLSFVIVQVPYLFGGMELVQNTPDFKLAEYARRGFGELVTVSALVLPTLLVGHWLIRKEAVAATRLFRILAGTQIGLLFVIMASAAQRMVLLTGSLGYGMTTVRLYPMIVMIWLAIVLVWFGATVLRGARQHFAWGALWSAFFVLGATHFLNPDAFVVRTNIALMQQGRPLDANYTATLSADAVPAMLDALPAMELDARCEAKLNLHMQYRKLGQESGDIRSLNWSRRHAWHLLNRDDATIHDVAGCQSYIIENLQLPDGSDEIAR